MLSVENLSCGYGRAPVVREVSFTLEGGQFLALLGPNGAGKSTLLREGGVFAQGGAEEVLARENIRAVYGVDTQPLTLRGRPYLLPIPPD